jgi:ribonuclease BN (tRNA processing enzyme)
VRLVILGSGGGWPRPNRPASGYLLTHEGFNVWLDAGTGTMAELQDHVELLDLDAVVVSHQHFDHFLDIYPYFLSVWYDERRTRKIPLYAPRRMFEHARKIEEHLGDVFESRPVKLGSTFELGPIRVATARMSHPVPTMGMRFETNGTALTYTADTGPSDDMVRLAKGSDLLLSEATWIKRPSTAPMELHMTATEAGAHARKAEAGNLMLTHIWPAADRDAVAEEADKTFKDGPVQLAEPGRTVDL